MDGWVDELCDIDGEGRFLWFSGQRLSRAVYCFPGSALYERSITCSNFLNCSVKFGRYRKDL